MAHVRATKDLVINGRPIQKDEIVEAELIPPARLAHGLDRGVFIKAEEPITTAPQIRFAKTPDLSTRGE